MDVLAAAALLLWKWKGSKIGELKWVCEIRSIDWTEKATVWFWLAEQKKAAAHGGRFYGASIWAAMAANPAHFATIGCMILPSADSFVYAKLVLDNLKAPVGYALAYSP